MSKSIAARRVVTVKQAIESFLKSCKVMVGWRRKGRFQCSGQSLSLPLCPSVHGCCIAGFRSSPRSMRFLRQSPFAYFTSSASPESPKVLVPKVAFSSSMALRQRTRQTNHCGCHTVHARSQVCQTA
jgi:hypothetical protein